MRNTRCHRLLTLSVLLFLCSITNPSEDSFDYVVTVGGEQLHFAAQPQTGYVIKMREEIRSTDNTGRFLKSAEDVKINTIRGPGRKGIYVVYNELPTMENRRMIKTHRVYSEVQYTAPLFSSNGETVAVIPEIVVRVKPGTKIEQVQAICDIANCTVIKQIEFTEQEYLIEAHGQGAEAVFAAVEELNQAPEVEWACPNTASQPKLSRRDISDKSTSDMQLEADESGQDANSPGVLPNDEYFPMQWHLHNTGQSGGTPGADIRAPEAWEITTGDPNIVIAVIGMGVDSNHPDLVNNLVPGYDFFDNDDQPDPSNYERLDAHDTLCAGLVAAEGDNGIGVTGVAYHCKIMPIRDGNINNWITREQHATAFRWAAAHGADIISCSWGRSNAPVIHSAVQDVTAIGGMGREGKGCIVLFAVNIDGVKIQSGWTETYPEVIAVGATDHNDVRWHYSGYGPELDLMAPSGCDGAWCGESVTFWSTDQTGPGGYSILNSDPNILDYSEYFGGTSASCPIVAGVAALVLSVNPNLTNLEVQRILYHSAHDLGEPGRDEYYGWGRVDARAAVEMALNPPLDMLYVDDDGTNDPGPGDPNISDPDENGSAEHPFDSIQKAIDYALDTEKIAVLPGIYTGEGNRDIDFGGKILTVRSESGPATCVIDCQGLGRGFYFQNGEDRNSVLEGFTIINGKSDNGGAISCMNNSSPTIRNCIFSRNSALGLGGAISSSDTDSAAVLINCTFHANTDLLGGGAVCNFSDGMIITNCILRDNEPGEIFSSGTINITYSNIYGGFQGEGNIDADPLFADPNNGDYHLKSQTGRWDPNSQSWVKDDVTSPCIDAGDPNTDFSGETWPHGGRINMGAHGGTREASMSTEIDGMTLPNVAYIFSYNDEAAESFESLLESYGCPTTMIKPADVPTTPLDSYDLIIVANDTQYEDNWSDPNIVTTVEDSGKPIIGLGDGGYDFFGLFELSIGNPYGGHGSKNSIEVIDPNCSLFSTPYTIEIPADQALQLYTDTNHVGIYLWPTIPETVTILGREVDDVGYFSLVMQHNRYLLWGFTESPQKMTEIGKTLFVNVVIWTANKAWESGI